MRRYCRYVHRHEAEGHLGSAEPQFSGKEGFPAVLLVTARIFRQMLSKLVCILDCLVGRMINILMCNYEKLINISIPDSL